MTTSHVHRQVRLLEEDASYCSYGEAYEMNCSRYGREPDIPIISFKRAICNERGDLTADPNGQLRLQVRSSIVLLEVECDLTVRNPDPE